MRLYNKGLNVFQHGAVTIAPGQILEVQKHAEADAKEMLKIHAGKVLTLNEGEAPAPEFSPEAAALASENAALKARIAELEAAASAKPKK